MTEAGVRANLLLEEAAEGARDEIVSSLRELGLSGHASAVLFALARVSDVTAPILVVQTGIPDSKIYYALRELVELGLVEMQESNPRRYAMVRSAEVEARLDQLLTSRYDRQRSAVSRVASLLEPLRSGARSPAMDLAYIVKGEPNVFARANALIGSARREVVLLASEEAFLHKLEQGLIQAGNRGVQLKLAIPSPPADSRLNEMAQMRAIVCSCRILVVDGEQILTVSDTAAGGLYAITSTDETLVRLGQDYWESPRCCVA